MKRLFSCLAFLSVMSCGAEPNPSFGEACRDIGAAFCAAITACGNDPVNEAECRQFFFDACCEDQDTCEDETSVSQDQINDCVGDIPNLSCSALVLGELPSSCTSL